MIFKKLFAPSYQSSDPAKRIASIDLLNKEIEKDKSILHELAFNDESEKVSLAALEKLDSFVLWMKSAETSASARIKKHAQKMSMSHLEQVQKVNDRLFVAFVGESKNRAMLEQLVFSSQRLQAQPKLCLQVLFSLQNENQLRRFFHENANTEQQLEIVEKTQDIKTLNRYAKLAKDGSVQQSIQQKLDRLADLKDKPVKIKQVATLINSRLLALKDAHDYEYLLAQLDELTQNFEQIKGEFSHLDALASASFTEKYLALKVSLQQKVSGMRVEHEEQAELKKISIDLNDIQQRCIQVQQQIDLIVQNCELDPVRNVDAEVKILVLALDAASDELDQLQTPQLTQSQMAHIKQLHTSMKSLQARLGSLPEIATAASAATTVIMQMREMLEQKSVDQKLTQQELIEFGKNIDQAKQTFNQIQKNCGNALPLSLVKEFTPLLQRLYQSKKQFGAYYMQVQQKCENKLKVVDRMIKDGKFTTAISTFHYVQKLYDELAEYAKPQLIKQFEKTKEEVIKLQDWQAYIAQPRKPLLIEQVKSLLDSNFEDPYERAEQVKQFRNEWMSLGTLHTAEDSAHNKEFDALIERAFAPCRAFFAVLDKQREQNYQSALAIVEQARSVEKDLPDAQLAATISSLRSAFRQIGDIDNTKSPKVKRAFNNALKPLNARIASVQADNARQKQNLLDRANMLLANVSQDEDLKDATQQAKVLQQEYKAIGFGGKGEDNKLWDAFRQTNDALFARYHESLSAHKSSQQAHYQRIDTMLNDMQNKLHKAKQHTDLQFYDEFHAAVLEQLADTDEFTRKKLLLKVSKIEQLYADCIKQMDSAKEANTLNTLFAFMHDYSTEELPASFGSLLSRHKAWVKGEARASQVLQGLDRPALTQVAAILHNKSYAEVPVGNAAVRKDLQLKMMAVKLEGNEIVVPEDVLAYWVGLGPVLPQEHESLAALEGIFNSNE